MFNHPNLIGMLASFENEVAVNIVMERAMFGSVKPLLRRNDDWLKEPLVAKIIACAANGLAVMHRSDVIHRDIKPDNLVITKWKPLLEVKICDFGEAERKGTGEHRGYMGGTHGYCSPEHKNGSSYGPPMDMWSLGITLYELLFGVLPFDQEDAAEANINTDDRNVSENGRDLLFRLLEKDPCRRITANDVLKHPWIKDHTSREIL